MIEPIADQATADLPLGKHCRDCHAFELCEWLVQATRESAQCDWSPSRFRLRRGKEVTP